MSVGGMDCGAAHHSPPISVLYVEDDAQFAETAARWLEKEGDRVEVRTTEDPSEGLSLLAQCSIDCIVSDYKMPEMTGLEFLEKVRETAASVPFILFTGHGSEEVASDAFSAGATDYLQKGSGVDQFTVLTNRIETAVANHRADKQRERQLTAIETVREGICILNDERRFVYVNNAYADLHGYTTEELLGEPWSLVAPDCAQEEMAEDIFAQVHGTGFWHGELTGLRADQTTFPKDLVISTTADDDLVCTVRDLSAREAWEQKRDRLQTLVDTINDPIYVVNEEGRFEYVNDAFAEMTGYDIDRIIGSPPGLVKTEDSVEKADEQLSRLLSSSGPDEATFEVTIRPQDGEPIICEDHMGVLPYEGQSFNGSVGILRDITDLRTKQRQLKQQNKRLDEFVGVVSHDLRNPLNVVAGNLRLALESSADDSLETAMQATNRMEELIENLLQLAREGTEIGSTEPVAIDEAATSCWETTPTEDASLTVDTTTTVQADASRLRQLFENLFRNAVNHGGDSVSITVDEMPNGFYVADDGPGIPAAKRETVLKPGHATDQEDGFGLAIVNRIAIAHGWEFEITDSATGGARFEILTSPHG